MQRLPELLKYVNHVSTKPQSLTTAAGDREANRSDSERRSANDVLVYCYVSAEGLDGLAHAPSHPRHHWIRSRPGNLGSIDPAGRWIAVALIIALLVIACETAADESTKSPSQEPVATGRPSPPTPTPRSPQLASSTVASINPSAAPGVAAQVVEVVDGDTLKVVINGRRETVRLISIDTPETKDPNEPVGCYGPEASAFTKAKVPQQVYLEQDVSETDRYGRLLRYVWLFDNGSYRMLNELLVQEGYAQVSTYPPDVRYQHLFLQRQREAREANAGLWGACGGLGVSPHSNVESSANESTLQQELRTRVSRRLHPATSAQPQFWRHRISAIPSPAARPTRVRQRS